MVIMSHQINEVDTFPSDCSEGEILKWFRKKINLRDVPPPLVYHVASQLYNFGRFVDAISCINLYRSLDGHIKKEADHLQAYACWKLTLADRVLEYLSNALKFDEFQNDWQLLVEAGIGNFNDDDAQEMLKKPKIKERKYQPQKA